METTVELTREWKQDPNGYLSCAQWKGIKLLCHRFGRFVGEARLGRVDRAGPRRKSAADARRDAEMVAVELLLDIRDWSSTIVATHGAKVELTKDWEQSSYGLSSSAEWKNIDLTCRYFLGASKVVPCQCRDFKHWLQTDAQTRFVRFTGHASLGMIHRDGPNRKSLSAARQDAENLAVEILLDIRDGSKTLMVKYGMDDD